MNNLRQLFLNCNDIETLPIGFGDLNILALSLDNNNIKEFPMELIKMKKLFRLSLGNNKIHIIPKEIEYMDSLDAFNIMDNPIERLPKELFTKRKLKRLGLDITNLANSQTIFQWINNSSIEVLSITMNSINDVPKEINFNPQIQELQIIYKQEEVDKEKINKIKEKLNVKKILITQYNRVKFEQKKEEYFYNF